MLPSVANRRPAGDPFALEPDTVPCANCGCTLGEDEAQAFRWGWGSNGVGDLYPFCEVCARRESAPDAPRSEQRPLAQRRAASSPGS